MDRRSIFTQLPAPLVLCAIALGYFVAARLGLLLSLPGTHASPIWAPSGLAFAAAWLVGRSALPGVYLGALSANLSVLALAEGVPGVAAVLASAAIAAGNTAEAWLATVICRRFNTRGRLDTLAKIFGFLAAALAASTVAATSGVAALWAAGAFPSDMAGSAWLTWWLGDATGMIVVAPLLLALARRPSPEGQTDLTRGSLALSAVLLAAAAGVTFVAHWPGHLDRLAAFTLVAYVAWHAMRWSFLASTGAVLAVAAVSVAGTMAGRGPFVQPQVNDSLIALDGFLLLCAVTGLALSSTRNRIGRQLGGWRQGAPLSLALLLSIACTLVAWHLISRSAEGRSEELFAAEADRLVNVIREHMHTQEQALRGARGLMDASVEIDALQWKRYVHSLDLPTAFPGVQGVGFATATPQDKALETEIVYLEPMDDRNQRALGFDMYSEPVRRQAMQRARDLDEPALSGKVILKQEDGHDVQAGVLMYLPVFDHPPRGARRFRGYVYSAFRMNDLLNAALRGQPLGELSLAVFDGTEVSAASRLFSTPALPGPLSLGTVTRTADIAGRRWTVQVTSAGRVVDNQKAQITLIAGSIISLLLFSALSAMAHTRQEALELAQQMSRRRAEAERRFQSLAESASDSILILDGAGRISFCNQAAGHMFGGAPAQVQTRALAELVDLPPGFGAWLKCLARGIPCGVFTTQANGPSGKVDVEVSMGAWLADGQSFASLILHDISARAAAERHLAQARSDLQSVVDNMPAKVASWDKSLRNRFCNRDYGDWFGARPNELIGRSIESILDPADHAQALPYIQAVLQGQPQSFERQASRPDGSVRHLQVYYAPDVKNGEVEGFFSLTFDITALKQTEKALRHGLRLHDVIFAHAGVGIACTRERRFERVSRRCTELFGYEDGELDGQPARVVYPDDEAYALITRMAAELLPAGRTLDHELALRRKDGSPVWCRLMARAVDPQDPSQGTIWIIDDFGDRKQQQDLLESARQSAEAAARLKSQFLANMSHEIRTPMNAIIGMTRLTLDGPLDDVQRDNLQMVDDAANSLLRLLNDILDLSKMEAGKVTLAPAAFDVREQLAVTLQQLAPAAEAKGLELILTVDPAVPAVATADAGRLMQIVTNLCSNAIKFTERGRVECQVDCSVAGPGAGELRVAVVDTGIGMSAEALERVFQAFEQADGSIARRFGGTGLGLSICSQLASLMGGRLSVQSAPGHGARFEATVRLEHAGPAPSWSNVASRLPPSLKVATLLKDARATDSVHALLGSWGVTVIDAAASNPPDEPGIVWVADAAQWLALPEAVRETPARVVLLGSSGAPRGDVAMLRKPIRHSALRSCLAKAVGGPREPAAAPGCGVPGRMGRAARPLRVLLVDDHPANQRLAAMMLERRGHSVALAGDGEQAVAAALAESFDAVLMDLQMPGVDGETAMRAIRAREQLLDRRTPIIALTANAMAGERERLLDAGMDGYLSKPFRPDVLFELVESVSRLDVEAV